MFRRVVGLGACIGSTVLVALACDIGPCGGGEPSCFEPVLTVFSPAGDLVSAEGCGRNATCPETPCKQLWVTPPADGGRCDTIVTFADGGTETISFDWGTAHPGQCCGTSYDENGGTITVHRDASTD